MNPLLQSNSSAMLPKRSALKLEQPAAALADSESSSDISMGFYRRSRQWCRSIKQSERNYSALNLEALRLCWVWLWACRSDSPLPSPRYAWWCHRQWPVVRDTLRILNGILTPLSESLDELTALEGALLSCLRCIYRSIVVCSRRASIRPHRDWYCRFFLMNESIASTWTVTYNKYRKRCVCLPAEYLLRLLPSTSCI